MYTEESTKSLVKQIEDFIEFSDLSLKDCLEANRIYNNLKGDLK